VTAASAPALELRPAPKHLAMLAAEMRADWDYEDIRQALIACSKAGWDDIRIYRETFRLLLIADSGPGDLRALAGRPARTGGGMSEETRQALEAARGQCAVSPTRVHPQSDNDQLGETG